MTTSRDRQRSKVYAAEGQVRQILGTGGVIDFFGSTLDVPAERKFGDVDSIAPYLHKVLAYAPVARLPRAQAPVTVRERRGASEAHYEYDAATIAIPPYRRDGWALRESVVLHELAHHLCGPGMGHGPAFTAMLAHLFDHVIGPVAKHLLLVAYDQHGVEVGPQP